MKKQIFQQAGEGRGGASKACDQGEGADGAAVVQNLQAVTQLLEIQRDLAIDLLPDRNLRECLDVLLASAMRLPGFDCGGIYLCDEDTGELHLIAHHGLSAGFVEGVSHYPSDSPQAMLVRAGALVYAMRPDLPPEVAGMIASEGLESLAVIPVRDDGRVIAALNVSSHRYTRIEMAARVALESLVAQAEGAIVLIRAREARQHAERQLRLAVDGAELGTWVADFESGVFEASPRARELHGIAAEVPLTVQSAMDPIHPEDQPKVMAALERTIQSGEPFSLEYRIGGPDGGGRWILSEARSFDHNGRKRLYGIARDITGRKRAEAVLLEAHHVLERRVAERTAELEAANAALREESMRLEWALDASQAGTSKWEFGSPTLEWDNRERALFGFAEDAPVSIDDLMARVHPDDRPEICERMAREIPPGGHDDWNHEFRIHHPVLGIRWIAGIGRISRDDSGQSLRVAGINFDITERKQAEQAMREWNQTLECRVAARTLELNQSEARFRQLAEATFEGIAVTEGGILLDGNAQFAALHGYSLAEMIGRPVDDFIVPESRDLVAQRIRDNDENPYEFVAMRRDGSTFPAEAHGRMTTWQGRIARVTALRDLTPVKGAAARLQAQQTELEHAQRLALVSEVSTGIIHQIGQPLCAMGANISVALDRLRACDSPVCGSMEIVRDIEADVARLREAVTHLRALAHPERAARVRTDFNKLVAGVLRLLRQEAENRRISLSADFGLDLPPIHADPVQLSQIILNVVRNAFDACADCPPERKMVAATTRQIAGEGIELCIRDTGSGIAPADMDRLFAPFFSTKPEGLGMGLRLSRTIVEAHGGTIEATNNSDGFGASFRVVLPIIAEPDEAEAYTKV